MEIWMVSLTETVGSEERGQRPAIVIAVQPHTKSSFVVPLTSNQDALKLPYSHKVPCSPGNGLSTDSIALVFQARSLTMTAGRFQFRMGSIEQLHFNSVKSLIKDYLQLE
jgi:mRNA-degrading endonuclease toxin of MazEF toxin-antitoxin module